MLSFFAPIRRLDSRGSAYMGMWGLPLRTMTAKEVPHGSIRCKVSVNAVLADISESGGGYGEDGVLHKGPES